MAGSASGSCSSKFRAIDQVDDAVLVGDTSESLPTESASLSSTESLHMESLPQAERPFAILDWMPSTAASFQLVERRCCCVVTNKS